MSEITTDQTKALCAPLSDGLPSCSNYGEFLRITGRADTPHNFVEWSRVAFVIMQPAAGVS